MKKFTFFLAALFLFAFVQNATSQVAQKANPGLSGVAWSKGNTGSLSFKPQANIAAANVFKTYSADFGLGNNDEMKLLRVDEDKQGMRHYRYQQYHYGYAVDGAIYLLHEKDGKVKSGNGKIIKGLQPAQKAVVLPSKALQAALNIVPSELYIWQDPASEKMLKEIKKNENATYYPVPQLIVFDKKYSENASDYVLAYKVEVYSLKPLSRKFVYVNAATGEVIHSIDMIQHGDVPAIGTTKYDGDQPVIIDSVSPTSYRLRETGRGNGIITRSAENTEVYSTAVDIFDDNATLFNTDDVAMSAHWATEKTYDYYFNVFGRNSYDNNGAILLSYVHYGNAYANAFWDGSRMTYGDGNSQYSAFTALDICGHEITHAVTTSTADLVYQDESGALSEAFSDIFGTCIEFYAGSNTDWLMGEDIGSPLRSMSNPNQYQNPDTYMGTYWDLDPNGMDNGGVHTNCGVGAYWFYLLSEGGIGSNDNGDAYAVTALGRSTAEIIAYNTLAYYLTPSSNYYETYRASLEAAESIYGACSNEVIQTANAWAAVGVGFAYDPQEIYILDIVSPNTACDLSTETVSVRLFYNGCNTSLMTSDVIGMAYQFDGGTIEYQDYTLISDWAGGDSLIVDFTVPVDASTLGTHNINCWVRYGSGTTNFTDSIMNYSFSTLLQQNIDLGVTAITEPVSDCQLSSSSEVTIKFGFFGCDFLPAGEVIDLVYQVNSNSPVTESYTLTADMTPSDIITYTFNTTFDGTADGTYTINAWTAFDEDTLTTNDELSGYTIKNIGSLAMTTTLGFEETNALDYVLIQTTPFSNVYIKTQAHAPGSTKGLLMTGGNAMSYIDMLEMPSGTNTWQINEFLSAKASFCVDATTWNTVYLKFGLKQTHGGTLYAQYIGGVVEDYRIASNLRILANNTQIGGTYNPTLPGSDPFVNHLINLTNYAGSNFTLTFETRNISKDTTVMLPFILDNAYIDNVHFFPGPIAVDDTASIRNIYSKTVSVIANDNNNSVASLKTGIIAQPLHGTAIINPDFSITYTPNTGYLGYDTITYKACYTTDTTVCDQANLSIRVHDETSIESLNGQTFIATYPNPFQTGFTLEFETGALTNAQITVTDVLGREIFQAEKDFSIGNNKVYLDLQNEDQGIYWIQIKTNDYSKVIKMVKK
ncbi:MAG: hypothetical protein CVU05_07665 [Bacteroidetes bacterium HGW-Bacteroidetes-21]|nr:MAG: hypothetical protein CVU05_07665 [Bacteroidetes bacterium HGW-Bacteroidetes-21]